MRWSSGFLKSSWMTLWSTYWTARSTWKRSTSSCSNCMQAIVPVASWSSVWSTLSAIGSPAFRSPSTRCSSRVLRVRLAAIRPKATPSGRAQVLAGQDPRDHLVDPVDAHGVVLACHGAARRRGVHSHELGLLVHERPAGVAGVDDRVGEDHVLVRAERVGPLVDRAERGGHRGYVAARRRQLGAGEARPERALRDVVRAWITHRHDVVTDLEVLLRSARLVLEA